MPVVETPETLDIFVTKCHTFEQRISEINSHQITAAQFKHEQTKR